MELNQNQSSSATRFQVNRLNSFILTAQNSRIEEVDEQPTSAYSSGNSSFLSPVKYSYNSSRKSSMSSAGVRKISSGANPNIRRKSSVFLPDVSELRGESNELTYGNYGKSLHNYTHDALPKMDNYRNLMSFHAAQRPTLDELREGIHATKSEEPEVEAIKSVKFGWIEGCLVRCLLNIWGVMLFLRLSWMVGQSGIIHSMVIIIISTIVTGITTLSMSACSTNGEIKGGGLYYMISRSLGPEFGGAIGVVFSFANSGMAALNIVGFSESMISLLNTQGVKIIDGAQNDNRIISCIALIVLQAIIIIGMEWEAKAQVGLLVILVIAMLDYVVGAIMGPQNDDARAKGWIGLNSETFMENLGPGYRFSEGIQQDFFSIFSIFFPAVAGIQAGASISGDLKDPGSAIPKGTLGAIFITSASYALFALLAGTGELREASGSLTDYQLGNFTHCNGTTKCTSGLYNDFNIMQLMSAYGPIIYAGCFAATLSSALSCLVSGPKTFQALCKDEVYPGLTRFGIGYGKGDEPYWSYALGFIIALVFILIADLNAIAPLISNFFMAAYALLNYCTFHASMVKPIGWRPTFKYYNTWLSFLGAVFCVIVMFLMSWVTALVSIFAVVLCWAIVIYRKPDLNWGTSIQAETYKTALTSLQRLVGYTEHAKNYRPQILCLSGFPSSRPALVDFGHLITKKSSLLICGNVQEDRVASKVRKVVIQNGYDWLATKGIKGFYVMVDSCKFDEGCQALIQSTGLGKLAPNILLLGYKTNWEICEREEVKEYFNCLHQALDNYLAITILRVQGGLDCSFALGGLEENVPRPLPNFPKVASAASLGFNNVIEEEIQVVTSSPVEIKAFKKGNKIKFSPKSKEGKKGEGEEVTTTGVYRSSSGELGDDEIEENEVTKVPLSIFEEKQGKGVIDVWWLYDDGGLTLLLPYIINTRKNWAQCQLRVFVLGNKRTEMELEFRGMASLLSKFRIDYSALTVIPDITKRAGDESRSLFEKLIKNFKDDSDKYDDDEMMISDSELLGLREKTNRHLRLRELLLEHSSKSNLIVMTLPVPRKGTVSAPLYMAWLEILTKDMPPFLLVRGNQTSVLTFYS